MTSLADGVVAEEEFADGEWLFVVRAQDERNNVGSEGFAPQPVAVEPRLGAASAGPTAGVRRCDCRAKSGAPAPRGAR